MPIVFAADTPLTRLLALWPVWLPLVAGGLAVYWLLPRPRGYPVLWGLAAGAAALALAGVLLIRADAPAPETVLFYSFAGLAVLAGAMLVTQRNPARAALSFALVVLSTCGLFLLLGAPFLTAATIIIYAGAIIVTFLFVLMLAQQDAPSDADARSREPLLATLTGFVLLGALLYVLTGDERRFGPELADVLARLDALSANADEIRQARLGDRADRDQGFAEQEKVFTDAADVLRNKAGRDDLARQADEAGPVWAGLREQDVSHYRAELGKLRALLVEARDWQPRGRAGTRTDAPEGAPLSALSGTPPTTPPRDRRRDPATGRPALPADNSAYLGRSLFTDYLLPVELAGTLLLVATIGAIAIAQRRQAGRGT